MVALVGRPNVGKSTLFNRLTCTRDALVADYLGLTRDRQYGRCRVTDRPFWLVDTPGVPSSPAGKGGLDDAVLRQVQVALKEADLVLFLVDAREGLTAADEEIAAQVRRNAKPVILVINKIDGRDANSSLAEFARLGFGETVSISAAHGLRVASLIEKILAELPQAGELEEGEDWEEDRIRVAVAGRPNVGKSTLINRLLGEERVVVADVPGTTRDTIAVPFERGGLNFLLLDTAGIRRRSRVEEKIEKFSVIKAIQAIEQAHVVIFLIDAKEGVVTQDARLLGLILEAGKAVVLGLNKWDGLSSEQKRRCFFQLETDLRHVDFAEKVPLSALHGTGVGNLFDRVVEAYEHAGVEIPTAYLTKVLHQAIERNPPPMTRGRKIRLKFAHQGGKYPPKLVIHGNRTEDIPLSYRRFLLHYFQNALKLKGTPLRIEFQSQENPYPK